MTNDSESDQPATRRPGAFKVILSCLALLAGAGLLLVLIFNTEPRATREGATKKSAMLVTTVPVEKDHDRPEVAVLGTVVPAREITLSPQVAGEVVERAEAFTPGGRVAEGELLLRIDPSDYTVALKQAESALHQAEADLALEEGQQTVAQREFDLLEATGSAPVNRNLMLREPQMAMARAQVEAAQAAVERAELDLERTSLRAPFDALVLERQVNVGSRVSPGMNLGRLVDVATYWVEATVPVAHLQRLAIPDQPGDTGAPARIYHATAWPPGVFRSGYIYAVAGDLEPSTRLARVLVAIPDPLALEADGREVPRMVLGSFVEVHLQLNEMRDVVRLSRRALRKNNTVWVKKDGRLDIRPVEVVFQNEDHAFIASGLEAGEEVVVSQLSRVVEGAELRTEPEENPAGAQPGTP